jgi:peroxiredoxin
MKPHLLGPRLLTGLVAAMLLTAATVPNLASDAKPIAGATAPAWSLKDVDGKTVSSADYKGKVVLLDFWATWCPPCKAEIPGFVAMQKAYGEQGLVVVGVSLDEEGARVLKPFMQQFGIIYPVVLGDAKTAQAFGGVRSIPTTFIISREGKIVGQHVGFADKAEFEKAILPLLAAKVP